MLALAAIAGMLPQSLLGPLVGVYVDRWDRKWTMILADSFIALCTLLLAVLFWLGVARMWHIYVLLACRSIGSAFHTPAMQASVPLLAPKQQLTRIAGINQIISSLSNIIGPAFGALLINLPAPPCCWSAFPIPNAARRKSPVSGASSAKGSAPCTPFRAWAGFSRWPSSCGSSSCLSV